MTEPQAPARSRGNLHFWRFYMVMWAALAGIAITYLAAIMLDPDHPMQVIAVQSARQPAGQPAGTHAADAERALLATEVQSLRDTVAALKTDIAQLSERRAAVQEAPSPPLDSRQDHRATSQMTTGSIVAPPPPVIPSALPAALPAAPPMTELQQTAEPMPATPEAGPAPVSGAAAAPDAVTRGGSDPVTRGQQAAIEPPRAMTPPEPGVIKPKSVRGNRAIAPLRPGSLPPLPALRASATTAGPADRSTAAARNTAGAVADRAVNTLRPMLLNSAPSTALDSRPLTGGGTSTPFRVAAAPSIATPPAAAQPVATRIARPAVATPPSFRPPSVTVNRSPTTAAALSLSTATSITGLRASWLVLTSSHPAEFAGYTPRYVETAAPGTFRLLAGPIENRAEADRICTSLRSQGVTCGVTEYRGRVFP